MMLRGVGLLLLAGAICAPHLARAETSRSPERPSDAIALADPEEDCFDAAPDVVSIDGARRTGRAISLEVLLVLDGISRARSHEVTDVVIDTYAEINIHVEIVDTRKARFAGEPPRPDGQRPSADVLRLMDDLKGFVGGVRPPGSDVVHLLTGKDVYVDAPDGRVYELAGMADCLGGVRYPRRAFSVSEGTGEYDAIGPEMAGIIAAHEVGHLLGGTHESGNCLEGSFGRYGRNTPCTAMWPFFISTNAGNFGTLERAIIRGYAEEFATP